MARHTAKEFAEKCFVTPAFLSQYKSRGKVVMDDNGLYDDTNEKNKVFYEKWSAKRGVTDEKTPKVAKKEKAAKPRKNENVSENETEEGETGDEWSELGPGTSYMLIEKLQKISQIEKNRAQTRLFEIDEQKKRGQLLPVELVKGALIKLAEHMKHSYKEAMERQIVVVAQKKGMSAEEEADLRAQMTKTINEMVIKGVAAAKKDIRNIAEQTAALQLVKDKEKSQENKQE